MFLKQHENPDREKFSHVGNRTRVFYDDDDKICLIFKKNSLIVLGEFSKSID